MTEGYPWARPSAINLPAPNVPPQDAARSDEILQCDVRLLSVCEALLGHRADSSVPVKHDDTQPAVSVRLTRSETPVLPMAVGILVLQNRFTKLREDLVLRFDRSFGPDD